ncbi:Uncharacterized conserved protein, DUF2336 family [Devosia lucknowensis]|uniref:Uncharacterized conserved protein, DUF2336 family n=1 Tax=Devosia lucknowensis TaxID=1096929 RepID=A0A1Y6EV03_9HYPH|nr:DUF2336 domain-containing protein [Devosia lucknowensis]SMQ66029.1 Uncharacterized conserved protein, DUF2336 family [Devosia lucknowensis]
MIGYNAFSELSQSSDSDARGHAAHLAAMAYLNHDGPADEHAALYAALISFLDDPSVKVRAALAYGLLHSSEAPRPLMLALLRDSAIIARAVLQYSPVLVDVDMLPLARTGDSATLLAIVQRQTLTARMAETLIGRGDKSISLRILRRPGQSIGEAVLLQLATEKGDDAELRGALLALATLPDQARLHLVGLATEALRNCRLVKGSLAPARLERLLRDGADSALSNIGETASIERRDQFVDDLVGSDRMNTRVLLHSVATGRVLFFSACLANLSGSSRDKVLSLLEHGSRAALAALMARCGLNAAVGRLLVRLVLHARSTDLTDDLAARHYVVTALTEELLEEYEGSIPVELEEAFSYLSEQNISLARKAARGVMTAFARSSAAGLSLPRSEPRLELPAA